MFPVNKLKKSCVLPVLATLALIGATVSPTLASAAEQRAVALTTAFPSVTISKNQSVTLPVKASNKGEADELVSITLTVAQGWEASLVNEEFGSGLGVRSLFLAPKGEQTLFFRTTAPSGVKAGDYVFTIRATSQDKVVDTTLGINVRVEEKAVVQTRLVLSTPFPDLRSPPGSSFSFNVDVSNEGSEDRTVSFSAESPKGWEVSFRPRFEQKLIANMGMKGGETKAIEVELIPPTDVTPGEYATTVRAASDSIAGTLRLTITIIEKPKEPTFELVIGTITGRLNAEAVAGRESHLSILAVNNGDGVLRNINFFSSKPEGWDVAFTPSRIDTLAPRETREVAVTLKPTPRTISGDYSVTVGASADRGQDSVDLRVTVGTSTTWGWVGLGIVVLVIIGIAALFSRLGRR
ncbi:MAG: hypothetical protein HYX95_01340 [Chloroflexi bacterium]|nr:hypothetical protein [Chloroflexota bacterium]